MSGNNTSNVILTPIIKTAIKEAINKIGNQPRLAQMLGISKVSVGRWIGTKNAVAAIDCAVWLKLRKYMEQNGIVKPGDIQFMTPEELRNNPIVSVSDLSQDEMYLVKAYRLASDEQKRMLKVMASSIISDEKRKHFNVFKTNKLS